MESSPTRRTTTMMITTSVIYNKMKYINENSNYNNDHHDNKQQQQLQQTVITIVVTNKILLYRPLAFLVGGRPLLLLGATYIQSMQWSLSRSLGKCGVYRSGLLTLTNIMVPYV